MVDHPSQPSSEIDALIIGAGFAGIYSLYALRKAGFSAKIFEKGGGLGGVWHWNRYPGVRVDTEFCDYQYSIEELWKDWNWSERFPDQKELTRYFEYVDQRLEISKDVFFNTRVAGARFDSSTDRWIVTTDGELLIRPRFMVLCTGICSEPYIPAYEGLDLFRGIKHHTARWPQEAIDVGGKRVGVIGTGASGVQVIQEVAPTCEHLTVFQRKPAQAMHMEQYKLDRETQTKLKETYPDMFERRKRTVGGFHFDAVRESFSELSKEKRTQILEELWQAGSLKYWSGTFGETLTNEAVNAEVYEFWRQKTVIQIKDPKLQEKLAPKIPPYPFGTKRHSLETYYYEAYNLPNVALVDLQDNPIGEITECGLRTKDGVEHQLDILVLATGFDAYTGTISQIDIQGTDGVALGERWKKKVSTYLGLACANYPNMFIIYGAQTPSAICNGPTCAEYQGAWVTNCLINMRDKKQTRIDVDPRAEKEWTDTVNGMLSEGFWMRSESWYTGSNVPGKTVQCLTFMWGLPLYKKMKEERLGKNYAGFKFGSCNWERTKF